MLKEKLQSLSVVLIEDSCLHYGANFETLTLKEGIPQQAHDFINLGHQWRPKYILDKIWALFIGHPHTNPQANFWLGLESKK